MNPVAEQTMKPLFFRDIDAAAQCFFKIGDEATGKERCRVWAGFNQKIEVAVGPGVAAYKRTENLDARDAVAFCDRQYPITVFCL